MNQFFSFLFNKNLP